MTDERARSGISHCGGARLLFSTHDQHLYSVAPCDGHQVSGSRLEIISIVSMMLTLFADTLSCSLGRAKWYICPFQHHQIKDSQYCSAPRQVVRYFVAEGQSQNHQGCHAACARPAHAHVQLSRIQGLVPRYQSCLSSRPLVMEGNFADATFSSGRHQNSLSPLCILVLHCWV